MTACAPTWSAAANARCRWLYGSTCGGCRPDRSCVHIMMVTRACSFGMPHVCKVKVVSAFTGYWSPDFTTSGFTTSPAPVTIHVEANSRAVATGVGECHSIHLRKVEKFSCKCQVERRPGSRSVTGEAGARLKGCVRLTWLPTEQAIAVSLLQLTVC